MRSIYRSGLLAIATLLATTTVQALPVAESSAFARLVVIDDADARIVWQIGRVRVREDEDSVRGAADGSTSATASASTNPLTEGGNARAQSSGDGEASGGASFAYRALASQPITVNNLDGMTALNIALELRYEIDALVSASVPSAERATAFAIVSVVSEAVGELFSTSISLDTVTDGLSAATAIGPVTNSIDWVVAAGVEDVLRVTTLVEGLADSDAFVVPSPATWLLMAPLLFGLHRTRLSHI